MGNTEEILLLSARLPAVRSLRSREAEARMHNFMMYDAAYRLRRDSDFSRYPICITEQSRVFPIRRLMSMTRRQATLLRN